jgi:prefoldin subunit 5
MSEEKTTGYVELSSQAYGLAVDAIASSNQRLLDYWRSVWDITSRPYASTDVDAVVREGFDRATKVLSLTIEELHAQQQKAQELIEKVAAQGSAVQDSALATVRELLNTSISNLNYVKESTTQQLDGLTKRLDELQSLKTS